MLQRLLYRLLIPACLLLGACQGYDVKINEKVVYAPRPLFTDFTTPDPGLTSCLERAINDGIISAAPQLVTLDCSFAGIVSLKGLPVFTGLTTLRLSANNVRNLAELGRMPSLEALYLDDNQIVDTVPLQQLPNLRHLDLAGNDTLQCPTPGSLSRVTTVILPVHCR